MELRQRFVRIAGSVSNEASPRGGMTHVWPPAKKLYGTRVRLDVNLFGFALDLLVSL